MKTKDIASRRFWHRMPLRSTILFLLAVFLIFAPIGFIMDIWQGGKLSIVRVWLSVLYSGLVSIGYAYSFTRDWKILPFTIIFQIGFHFIPWTSYFPGGPVTASEIQGRMVFDGLGIIACIILAYIVFINFITKEGVKQIALSKEMELAGEIHRVLVPDINVNDDHFEITGRSIPTAEVGGDLIDRISDEEESIVYMIDVSGHGVGPGLLSGMFKAAFRSVYESGKSLEQVINKLNRILLSQRKKGMFVTFGGLKFSKTGKVEMLSAGHPPIIQISKEGKFKELKLTQLPLLTLKDTHYKSQFIDSNPGDMFIIYSDGIIETINKVKEEFGSVKLNKVLRESIDLPTEQISNQIYNDLDIHGSSHDDQSIVIIVRKN